MFSALANSREHEAREKTWKKKKKRKEKEEGCWVSIVYTYVALVLRSSKALNQDFQCVNLEVIW